MFSPIGATTASPPVNYANQASPPTQSTCPNCPGGALANQQIPKEALDMLGKIFEGIGGIAGGAEGAGKAAGSSCPNCNKAGGANGVNNNESSDKWAEILRMLQQFIGERQDGTDDKGIQNKLDKQVNSLATQLASNTIS